MRQSVVCLLFVALFASRADAQFKVADPAPGENFNAELAFMWWFSGPEILIQTDALAAIDENQVDFVREFGLEEERFREFRATIKTGRTHKIRINYVPVRYNAETVLERTFTFGGQTYEIGLPANGEVEWKVWRFGYEWDFVARDRGFVGFVADAKYNEVNASLESPIGSSDADAKVVVPTLGVIARGYVHRNVSVTAEYTGFKLPSFIADRFRDEGEEIDAEFTDFDFYTTASVSRYFGVQAGYRWVKASYITDEDSADLKLKGFYFGAMVRF